MQVSSDEIKSVIKRNAINCSDLIQLLWFLFDGENIHEEPKTNHMFRLQIDFD